MILITLPFMRRKGIALFPFIILRRKDYRHDKILMNHERIHLRQQLELLVVPFYLIYFINYLYQLISTLQHETAYRNIIFEQEAYDHERDPDFLSKRKFLGFLDYL